MAVVQVSAVGSTSLSLTGVAAGNTVIVLIAQYSADNRTYSVSDDVVGAYTNDKFFQGSTARRVSFQSFRNHPGGNITISVTPSASSQFVAAAIEVSGLDDAATPITGEFSDAGNTNTHHCAAVGEIDTSGAALILIAGALNSQAGVTSVNPTGSYTEIDAGLNQAFLAYWDAPSAVTDERGQWTSGGTARTGIGAIIAYPAGVGGGGGSSILRQILMHHQ